MKIEALLLLIAFNVTHWAADYTHLSIKWMLDAKRLGKPLTPIFLHAWVHTVLIQIVLVFFIKDFRLIGGLMAFELFTHFGIDLLKGRLNGWFPSLQSPANKYHWYVFGADQFLHQVVLITMVYFVYS